MIKTGIFRKSSVQVRPAKVASTDDSVVISEEVKTKNGITQIEKKISSSEYAQRLNLPSSNDYTLKNLLASGVPLSELPVNGMLQSDPLSAENVAAAADATSKLQEEMSNSEKTE